MASQRTLTGADCSVEKVVSSKRLKITSLMMMVMVMVVVMMMVMVMVMVMVMIVVVGRKGLSTWLPNVRNPAGAPSPTTFLDRIFFNWD